MFCSSSCFSDLVPGARGRRGGDRGVFDGSSVHPGDSHCQEDCALLPHLRPASQLLHQGRAQRLLLPEGIPGTRESDFWNVFSDVRTVRS